MARTCETIYECQAEQLNSPVSKWISRTMVNPLERRIGIIIYGHEPLTTLNNDDTYASEMLGNLEANVSLVPHGQCYMDRFNLSTTCWSIIRRTRIRSFNTTCIVICGAASLY